MVDQGLGGFSGRPDEKLYSKIPALVLEVAGIRKPNTTVFNVAERDPCKARGRRARVHGGSKVTALA